MNTLVNKYDTLELLIYSENVRIQSVDAHPEMDMMLILLNTGSVLKTFISAYQRLRNASKEQLQNYELIGKGAGVHWPALDEDLSLKGFLRDAIKMQITSGKVA